MTRKRPLWGSTPPGLAGCPLYRVPLPAQPAQGMHLVLWPPLPRGPMLQPRISQALGKGRYSGGSCLCHQQAVWAWQSSSTSLGFQSLIHDALSCDSGVMRSPKGTPSADQVTQGKADNGGSPGPTLDPLALPYRPVWMKRSEREELSHVWKCCALLSRSQNGQSRGLYCRSICIDSVSGHLFPGCFSLK